MNAIRRAPNSIRNGFVRNGFVAIIALAGGFLGSMLHQNLTSAPTVVRAERFEVVERSGRLAAYLGPDPDPKITDAKRRGTMLVFLDRQGVRRCQIGSRVGDNAPELLFYDTDG